MIDQDEPLELPEARSREVSVIHLHDVRKHKITVTTIRGPDREPLFFEIEALSDPIPMGNKVITVNVRR